MKWDKTEKDEDGLYKIPENWIHIHYFEALNILC